MREAIKKLINNIFLPRWMVFFADMLVISFVFMFTWLLRYNLQASAVDLPRMLAQLAAVMPLFALSEYLFKPYQGILRHSSVLDALDVIKSHTLGTAGMILVTLAGRAWQPLLVIPWSVLISQFFISITLLIGFRFMVAFIYHRLVRLQTPGIPVMIFGAGVTGMMTKGVLEKDITLPYQLVGFMDDNPMLHQKKMEGITVYPPEVAFRKIVQ